MGDENDTGVPVASSHLAALPLRLTTREVCALGRWSVRTFMRRRKTGKFLVEPIDRAAELLFPRDPVLRALGLITDAPAPQTPPEKPRVSVDAIRASIASGSAKHAEKPARPAPMTPEQHRALLLGLRPGIRVWAEEDGRFTAIFSARRNHRATSWPPAITLPRVKPRPVSLSDEAAYRALLAEAETIYAECRLALKAEKAEKSAAEAHRS